MRLCRKTATLVLHHHLHHVQSHVYRIGKQRVNNVAWTLVLLRSKKLMAVVILDSLVSLIQWSGNSMMNSVAMNQGTGSNVSK